MACATDAKSAFGAFIQREDTVGSGTFTTVAEVLDITGPSMSRESLEATSHSSPNGWREFVKGIKNLGEFSFAVNWVYDNATQNSASTGLLYDFEEDSGIYKWRIVITAGVYIEMCGFLTQFSANLPVDGIRTADITIKLSGEPTFVGV